MHADQVLKLEDGRTRSRRRRDPVRYVYTPTHNHFHVMHFDRYSLVDVRTRAAVRPDRKSGFCLGDRDRVSPTERRTVRRSSVGSPASARAATRMRCACWRV